MASIKTKFRSKQHPGKLKGKGKKKAVDLEDDEDKTEREDSVSNFPFFKKVPRQFGPS